MDAGPASEAGLNSLGERAEIADALKLVIGQFDMEMLLDAREQVKRLQAIDAERLEEIVARIKLLQGNLEVLRRELKDFVGRFLQRGHCSILPHSS